MHEKSLTLTLSEAAALLGISRRHYRKLCDEGTVPAPVLAGRYSREQIEATARGEWNPAQITPTTDAQWKEALK